MDNIESAQVPLSNVPRERKRLYPGKLSNELDIIADVIKENQRVRIPFNGLAPNLGKELGYARSGNIKMEEIS